METLVSSPDFSIGITLATLSLSGKIPWFKESVIDLIATLLLTSSTPLPLFDLSKYTVSSGHSLSKSSVDEVKKKAANLSQIYEADLDSSDFQSEMASFKYQAAAMMDNFEKSSPIDILQLIHKYSLTDAYPNTAIAIRIFLTIPVTVATCERSFSKLKLIKNNMRSKMGQERLSTLTIISIEVEVANNIDFDDVISELASRKARKVTLN